MTGPATPGQEGPSEAPPRLPDGWIAQWDGNSRKYYFVQISTGVSTWEVPTKPAPGVPTPSATPQANDEHPYGTPQEGTRGVEGGDGERGLGSFAMQQLLGGKKTSNPNSGVMGLASQFLGGSSSSSSNHNSSSTQSSGAAGIVGALAGSLLGGKKTNNQPQQQQQSYGGQQNSQYNHQQGQQTYGSQSHSQGGSGMMSTLGNMFGNHSQGNQDYGYSNSSSSGGYSGQAPSASYQPSGASPNYHPPAASSPQSSAPAYNQNAPQGHSQQPSYGSTQPTYSSGGQQDYSAPAHQYGGSQAPAQHNAGGYGQEHHQYGGQSQSAGGYGSGPPSYGSQPQSPGGYGGSPPVSHESRPHGDHHGSHHPPPSSGYGYSGQGPPGPYPGAQPPHTGNLQQPEHHHFHGMHNKTHSGGLYGDGHPPQHGQQRW